ncbi:MAG: hypothetical protein MI723_04400, partial [Caulobacterales bacterium]|nr:hypothetical protein [Caulobacterales bacterium]
MKVWVNSTAAAALTAACLGSAALAGGNYTYANAEGISMRFGDEGVLLVTLADGTVFEDAYAW